PENAAACEKAYISRLQPIQFGGENGLTTAPEATLFHILTDRRDADSLPWQADVALMSVSKINWARLRSLALRFDPAALDRLADIRREGLLSIPELAPVDPASLRRKLSVSWTQYRIQSYWQKQQPSGSGFAAFLAQRWNARWVGQVPFLGAWRALQHFRGL